MPISSADGHLAPPVSADMQQHLSDSSLETRESAIPLAPQPQQPQGSVMSPDRPRTASPASPSSKRRPGPISIPPQPQLVGLSTATVQKESPSSAASPPAKPSVSPLPPSRPTRPDDSTKTLNPGWSHPFPSSQVPGSSPPRPPRPARPSEALLIDATSQSLPAAAAATFPRTPEQQHAFDNEAVDLADFAENIQPPPAATSSAGDSPELGADRPRKASSHRKPVPRFLPSPTIPLPARLSISGFEALISGSSPKKRGASDQQPGGAQERKRQLEDVPVFSPRVGLGLADAGVQAREARRVRDSSHGRSARRQGPTHREGGDIGRQAILSWSDRIRQREWDEPRRQPPPPSGATMAPGTTYIGRNPSTDSYRPLQLLNTPAPQHHRRRGSEPLPSHIRKRSVSRSISKDEKGLQEVVVVPSSWDDDSIDGDHMLPLREASFRPERMAFEMLEWRSWFPRTVHVRSIGSRPTRTLTCISCRPSTPFTSSPTIQRRSFSTTTSSICSRSSACIPPSHQPPCLPLEPLSTCPSCAKARVGGSPSASTQAARSSGSSACRFFMKCTGASCARGLQAEGGFLSLEFIEALRKCQRACISATAAYTLPYP